MKTLRIVSLLIVAALMFSCEKDVKDEVKTGEVSFGISHLDPMNAKDDAVTPTPDCPIDMVPVKASIKIDGIDDPFTPDVFYLNGELYTQALRFEVLDEINGTTYTITDFVLLNAEGNPIMATPKKDSDFAQYLTDPVLNALNLNFTVNAFKKTEKQIEVLCYMEHTYEYFGYNWFLIDEIIVREMCFFGDLCHKDPVFFEGTIYDEVFDLENSNYPFDLPALFEVRVSKENQQWIYQNYDENNNFIAPLCVKYPDLVKNEVETFTFELWVYVPVGDGVELVLFDTWVLPEDNGVLDWSPYLNEFDVVEFVIGNCNYDISDVNFYPPWQNLPETADANIQFDLESDGYWTINVQSVSPDATGYDFPTSGTYLGWCGDAYQTIDPGLHTFNLYSSMNVIRPWPTGMTTNITLESLAKVNWLMNNLTDFGYPALTGMFVEPDDLEITVQEAKDLQHAIWLILGFDPDNSQWPGTSQGGGTPTTEANTMAGAASDKGDFVPLPGGYAAVLMVANDDQGNPDPANNQLIFTVVDP